MYGKKNYLLPISEVDEAVDWADERVWFDWVDGRLRLGWPVEGWGWSWGWVKLVEEQSWVGMIEE